MVTRVTQVIILTFTFSQDSAGIYSTAEKLPDWQ